MSDELKKTIDVSQEINVTPNEGEPKKVKNDALSGVKRPLLEKELKNNPAAVQLILDMNGKLEEEIEELKDYKDKYYEEHEKASVRDEQLKSMNSKFVFISLGSLICGYLPSLWNRSEFYPAALVGAIFLLVGFLKK